MRRAIVTLALAATLAACDEPTPGDLAVALHSPNVDGAVEFVVTATVGEAVTGVAAACSGCRVFPRLVGDTEIRGIVTGEIVSGPLLVVTVSDVRVPESFTVRVVAAAAPDYALRQNTAGYGVTVGRAP